MNLVVKLDEQRRLEVPRSFFEPLDVKIVAGESFDLWALNADSNHLQILSPDSTLSKLRDRLENKSLDLNIAWDAGGDAQVTRYRQISAFLRLSCRPRTSGANVRITLPSEALNLGFFVPRGYVVLHLIEQIVEIWDARRWREVTAISSVRDFTKDIATEE